MFNRGPDCFPPEKGELPSYAIFNVPNQKGLGFSAFRFSPPLLLLTDVVTFRRKRGVTAPVYLNTWKF